MANAIHPVKIISTVIFFAGILGVYDQSAVSANVVKRQTFHLTPPPPPSKDDPPIGKYQDTFEAPDDGGGNAGGTGGTGGAGDTGSGGGNGVTGGYPDAVPPAGGDGVTGGYPASGTPSSGYGPPGGGGGHHGGKCAFDFTAIFDSVFALVNGVISAVFGVVNKKIEKFNNKLMIIHNIVHVPGTEH
ncbi:unnamed protein product [Allacma fusca]|uniref:Glycine-rich protein n=1 Tax=Allacma fusca TaxID=39272 RepID=A0A8J2KQJ0_9HEXA|nr:unnamed protein product [Allacma fusca]